MKLVARVAAWTALAVAALVACVGTTGGGVVTYRTSAAGPRAITAPGTYAFQNAAGWTVSLTRARLLVGAVYLRRVRPLEVVRATACVTPGDYVGEVTERRLVDLLDPTPQPFPAPSRGIADRALTAEVWLGGARIDQEEDTSVALDLAGTATRGATVVPFDGAITLGRNRAVPPRDPAQPGANPACQQRIAGPLAVDLAPAEGGTLVVRVDPAGILAEVEFDALPRVSDAPPRFRFRDDAQGQPDVTLANGLRAREGVYAFEWIAP